ncbi:hypothetical protein [Siphonobacter curvatus]|uniref:hypothetical protein n=1 Tax=Siphonobacter curvatus TaxID=2094562 RepID=UPI0013FD79E7|nr:hypothetical protein [Siphonobacter curvatus]
MIYLEVRTQVTQKFFASYLRLDVALLQMFSINEQSFPMPVTFPVISLAIPKFPDTFAGSIEHHGNFSVHGFLLLLLRQRVEPGRKLSFQKASSHSAAGPYGVGFFVLYPTTWQRFSPPSGST